MDKAGKIRVLEKMIKYIEKRSFLNFNTGFCGAMDHVSNGGNTGFCAAIDHVSNCELTLADIPEIMSYRPLLNEHGLYPCGWRVYWFHPRDYNYRIEILKEIIESLNK